LAVFWVALDSDGRDAEPFCGHQRRAGSRVGVYHQFAVGDFDYSRHHFFGYLAWMLGLFASDVLDLIHFPPVIQAGALQEGTDD
jgi:hypothetical protein